MTVNAITGMMASQSTQGSGKVCLAVAAQDLSYHCAAQTPRNAMNLDQIINLLETFAPLTGAESWDNVGLLVGDATQDISRILLTIDYTSDVAEEATNSDCGLIIAYHPPIFQPLKRVLSSSLIFDAIRRGVAIYSPHTALDAADCGTNDMLADVLGLSDRTPLRLSPGKTTHYKLVFFVPAASADLVAQAVFAAGAGGIGDYDSCSFRSEGVGTFFGQAGTNPAIGQSGKLERVEEIRIETLVPIGKADAVVAALRASHPYEEPAFDLNMLAAESHGQGRIGNMPSTARSAVIERIKRELNLQHLLIAGPTEGSIRKAAACAGSCGDMLDDAIRAGAELYLTGEMRHHDALKAAAAGMMVVCTLHSNSERGVLALLKKRLEDTTGMPEIIISKMDRDPFSVR